MSENEEVRYEYGEDVDFDKINEENLKKMLPQEPYKSNAIVRGKFPILI